MGRVSMDGFDWDDANRHKCRKHGVTIPEVESVFEGVPLVAPDVTHSGDEQRFLAVGRCSSGRVVFVAFTFRQRDELRLIRPISARFMHDKEVRRYEQAPTDPDER